jgi:hypothetical protein
LVLAAEVALHCQRFDDARAIAGRALAQSGERGERGYEAWAWCLAGEIEAESGAEPERAAAGFRAALTRAEALGMRPLAARCRLGLGALARRCGSKDDAEEQLRAAGTLFRSMDMGLWLSRTEALIAS